MYLDQLLKNKNKIPISSLHARLLDGTLSDEDRLLIARILKDIATKPEIGINGIVYGKDVYVNVNKKEKKEKF